MASEVEIRPGDPGPQLVRTWRPDGDSRATIVLVHGIAEHSGRYERTGDLLAEAGFTVVSADLMGCGGSAGRRADIEDWAVYLDQVQGLVEGAPRRLVLLGHSMGGLIALEYALAERPSPDLLVLSAPALDGGAAWQHLLAPVTAALLPTLRIPNALRGEQLSRDPAVGEAYFSDPLVSTSTTTRMGAELFRAMRRVRAAVGGLDVPTLVLHGGLDTIVPPTATLALEPFAERRLYPKLRHELFNEPEGPDILREVVTWIEEHLPDEG